MPEIKVQINSMAGIFSDVDAVVVPGEGGTGGQAYQAMYVNGKWVNNYWDSDVEYILNIDFVYDFDDTTMATSNIRLDSITLRDGSRNEVAGSFDVNLYKITFNKLNNGFIDNTVWAPRAALYNDQKAQQFIATTYGAAPGREEWRNWEATAVIDGGRVDVAIDHDPLNDNDISLFNENGDEQLGYFQYDGSKFVYYDNATGMESTDFDLTYNKETGTLHLMGTDGTYKLSQSYSVQIAPTPFTGAYIPVDGSTITLDRDGKLSASGTTYTDGDGIEIDRDTINVLVDRTTIDLNEGNQLCVNGNLVPEYYQDDIGKVLGVQQKTDSNTKGLLRAPLIKTELAWVDMPEGVPATTSEDVGKVLTVNQNGDGVEWATAGGGSGGSIRKIAFTSS